MEAKKTSLRKTIFEWIALRGPWALVAIYQALDGSHGPTSSQQKFWLGFIALALSLIAPLFLVKALSWPVWVAICAGLVIYAIFGSIYRRAEWRQWHIDPFSLD